MKRAGVLRPADRCPDVRGGEALLRCYADLSTARPVGFGVAPIPVSSIIQYAEYWGLGSAFVDSMLSIDRAWCDAAMEMESARNKG